MVLQQCVPKFQEKFEQHICTRFFVSFVNVRKEESKIPSPLNERKKTKKLSQTLRAYNSQMLKTILLKFGM